MTCRIRPGICGLIMAGLLLCAATSAAAPRNSNKNRQRARALFIKGNKQFARKNYDGALKNYRAARKLYASYKIDFNIGTTLELMKLPHRAAEHFEKFVLRADRDKDMRIVKMAWTKLLSLRKQLVRITVRCPIKGATVRVGDRPLGTTPLRFAFYLLPGTHTVVFSSRGRQDHVWTFKATPGTHRRHTAPWGKRRALLSHKAVKPLFPPPPPKRPGPGSAPFYKTWWFWTGVGVVVTGAVVTGGVLGTQGGGRDDRMPIGELGEIR